MENKILQAKIKDLEMEIAILKNSGNWLKRTPSRRQQISEQVVEWIKQHYEEMNGTLGYRQMTITINREHEVHYNKKRIYRLMQLLHLKSVTRVKKKKYIPSMRRIFFCAVYLTWGGSEHSQAFCATYTKMNWKNLYGGFKSTFLSKISVEREFCFLQ